MARNIIKTEQAVTLEGFQAVLKPSKFGYSLSAVVDQRGHVEITSQAESIDLDIATKLMRDKFDRALEDKELIDVKKGLFGDKEYDFVHVHFSPNDVHSLLHLKETLNLCQNKFRTIRRINKLYVTIKN